MFIYVGPSWIHNRAENLEMDMEKFTSTVKGKISNDLEDEECLREACLACHRMESFSLF
jgi:hypothetical protein